MPNTHEQPPEVIKRASVTLPGELATRATRRAEDLDRNFSSYIRWLIKRDLESVMDAAAAAVIAGEPHPL